MEGGHIPNQSNPQFGYVQTPSGVHYGTGSNIETGQNLTPLAHNLQPPGQILSQLGQNLSQPRQNLVPPGQSLGHNLQPSGQSLGHNLQQPSGLNLPPPPPLVRHGGHTSASSTQGEKLSAALENHFRRSLQSFHTTNIPSRNVNNAPSSMGTSSMGSIIGASMGTSSVPNQSSTRFRYPGQTNSQQYGQISDWRGSVQSAMRHPVAMPRGQSDPLIRQALGHEYNISRVPQDLQNNMPINQGQGHLPSYRYPGTINQINASSNVQGERMDPRFTNTPFHMSQNMTHNRPSVSQSSQNFAPNFNFSQMQRPQNYASTANQFSMNQSLPLPPPAHQNPPKMVQIGYQHQPGPVLSQSQGHSSSTSRQTSSSYPAMSLSLGNYGIGDLQGQISHGQGPIGMTVPQDYQGQNTYSRKQPTIIQDPHVQRQNLYQSQQPASTASDVQNLNLPASWQHAKLAGVVETISNLARLNDSADSEAKRKLMEIKDKCQRSGLLSPNESFPAFLAKYAIRERNKILGQQEPQLTAYSPLSTQSTVTATATIQKEAMRGIDNASAIHSAFAIPQSNEMHDKAALGRWYAAPSGELSISSQLPTPAGSNTIEKNIEQPYTMAAVSAPSDFQSSTAVRQVAEPFVLRPTVCTEEVIEYKVADLLRCLPKSVKAQIARNVEAEKSSEQATIEPNKDINHENSSDFSDKNGQQDIQPDLPMDANNQFVRESENIEMMTSDLREGTPNSDGQLSKTDSFFDINKRLSDELVLDYQFGTQDMDPDIDFRNYLPELHLPSDLSATPSPMLPEIETMSNKEVSLNINALNACSNDSNKTLPIDCQNEMDDNANEVIRERVCSVVADNLPEPTVEIDRDEVLEPVLSDEKHNEVQEPVMTSEKHNEGQEPAISGKKRKYGSSSDSNLGKPPVKRARGRGRGGQTRGRGKSWTSSLTPRNKKKQRKPPRTMKVGGTQKGRGRGKRGQGKAIIETDDSSSTNTEHERSESPSISGLDGQVIQKPQDLKTIMDNLPHEELEKTTVSLSTLKMMLAWTEAKANAGIDENDQESDNESVNSATGDTKNSAEDMDVMSEMNNKEHNQYEPPVDDEAEKLDKEISVHSKSEGDDRIEPTTEKIVAEHGISGKEEKDSVVKDKSEDMEINENSHSEDIQVTISKQSEEAGKENTIATEESVKENENQIQKETNVSNSVEKENRVSGTEAKSGTQVYSVTDTHKMTWVRYHGKTVTQLITPDGNFFIMKEILIRCFRIQEPNKRLKFSKIRILKRKVLKISDTELPPLFYDYVVKNLVERKVIKTIPDKFIIISEVDANRLFHYVCKDQYCGNSCVTPFFQSTSSSSVKQSEPSKEPQTKFCSKKDRNLFDFIESETVSPKSSAKKALKKRLSSSELINLCSDNENGYDSDKTLPYVDGKPVSIEEINGTKSVTKVTESVISVSNRGSEKTVELFGESESKGGKSASTESQNNDTHRKSLDADNSGQEKIDSETTVDNIDKALSDTNENLLEKTKDMLSGNSSVIGTGKSTTKCDHGNSKGLKSNKDHDADDVIIIDDEDDENISFTESLGDEGGVCQLTLNKMKKELGIRCNFDSNKKEKDSVELVQVHNIDSTAADNNDKSKLVTTEFNKQTSAQDGEKCDANIRRLNDSANRSERSVDTTVGIDLTGDNDNDGNGDVTIGDWIFPGPPRLYPEDGTKKLEEANETLQKLIERANKAQKKEEFVDVLDNVFKLTEPLKQWTNKLFDHYEEGLLIEAQRLKSLDQLQLREVPETINLVEGDETTTGNDR